MKLDITVSAILANHLDVSNALRELQRSGCDLSRISVIGKDAHTDGRTVGFYSTGQRMNYWGTLGAFWSGLWGMLNGSAFFVIPGIGQVVVAGPLVTAMIHAMEGEVTVSPHNALSAGLHQCTVGKDRLAVYETAIRGTKFVLFAHGAPFETIAVGEILKRMGYEVHASAVAKEPYTVEAATRVFVIDVT